MEVITNFSLTSFYFRILVFKTDLDSVMGAEREGVYLLATVVPAK